MADTMRQAFAAGARRLREIGIEAPELDARVLLCHAASVTRETFVAEPDRELAPETVARFAEAIERRVTGEPVSRIVGMREFYGREFLIGRHTLDPRPDTETLVDAALDLVERKGWRGTQLNLLDLGTGTGCILLSLLAELPNARGIGTDISEGALTVAAANACRLKVEDRAEFMAADWLDGITGTFDLILANPPYIASGEIVRLAREVRDHDPPLALDGGADGLDAYRRIVAKAAEVLRPGGALMVEIGADQADAVRDLFRAGGAGLDEPVLRHDISGRPRVVLAEGAKIPEQNVAA